MRVTARLVFLILITVWAGIIIGVSLIATPVKFQAPSLTMPVGVEIGRYTFRLLARVELCLLIASIVAASVAQPRWITTVVLALVIVECALQRYWLLPVLDDRVSQILAGGTPSFSIHHRLCAVIEAIKAALLITGAVVEYRSPLG
ncbi:MAG: hypothetical protein JOY54_04640 [Acidobacteriaceae bacterium]|nr:hypothetical protein [Acidobacteriaceae bacterium]